MSDSSGTLNNAKPITRALALLAALAGLLHDIGKATDTFQAKLIDESKIGLDVMRHERLSCAVLSSLYSVMLDNDILSDADDRDFFSVIAEMDTSELRDLFATAVNPKQLLKHYKSNRTSKIADLESDIWHNNDGDNACLLNALFFLILSHHKLPRHNGTDISERGFINEAQSGKDVLFVENAPFESDEWLVELQRLCHKLCQHDFEPAYQNIEAFTSAVLYVARPALVIADQNVSSAATDKAGAAEGTDKSLSPSANSIKDDDGVSHYAQPLNEHLLQVSKSAEDLVRFMLNDMQNTNLPALKNSPDTLTADTSLAAFSWQNEALSVAEQLPEAGNLILISSETGAGKTRANAKVTSALRNHRGLRLTTLLGMNTLTKQTATEYINDVGLADSACAITGHAVTRYEIEQSLQSKEAFEAANGQESVNDADDYEVSDSSFSLPSEFRCGFKPKYDQILGTPVVVATIDHLIDGIQSGKSTSTRLLQRLQTSDLVIDEIDSYSAKSLIPIYKLVYLAGFYNRNLIVSSATLRPTVAQTLVELFQRGLEHHNELFGTEHRLTGAVINNAEGSTFSAQDSEQFYEIIQQQRNVVEKAIKTKPAKRRLGFADIASAQDAFVHAKALHETHSVPVAGFKFSAGVLRLNNVKYVQKFARELGQMTDADTEIAVINYHSRIAAPVRYRVERCLDAILKRKKHEDFEQALLAEPEFKLTLEKAQERGVKNIMLIAVCSPIEETGRDHDFDYGITEPCSHHSLIQLAGRIRRHRGIPGTPESNMLMFNKSLKETHEPWNVPYLTMPGAETKKLTLNTGVSSEDAFACDGIDYTQAIDARACLIDYKREKVTEKSYSNLNEIEVQQVYNAHYDIFNFINDAHVRISESHAIDFPLRENNNDVPVWYNGSEWLMPENTCDNHDKRGKAIQCHLTHDTEELPNLWFNQDIDTILDSLNAEPALRKLLCSEHSSFSITQQQCDKLHELQFSTALGLFDPEKMA